MELITVTPDNILDEGIFCSKDPKNPGFLAKKDWYEEQYELGLRLVIQKEANKPIGFIEFCPAEAAWRPIKAQGYLFIQCIMNYPKAVRNQGNGSALIQKAEHYAKEIGCLGVCTVASQGPWLATPKIFQKLGYKLVEKKGRMELLAKKSDAKAKDPIFIDWEKDLNLLEGWHLFYSNQCPWHKKSVSDLSKVAEEEGLKLNVHLIENAQQAQGAPSGFGNYALVKDGQLLEDHYISATRFKNIIHKN